MSKEINNFTHCSKLDLIKMYKKSRRDMRRLSRQKVGLEQQIEKMKCCENCRLHCASPITIEMCTSNNYDNWEIKENE